MTEGSEPRDGLLKAITSRTAMGGAGEQQTNRTQREWCPVLRVPPAAATGAPGEQKHLPDMHTPRQQRKKRSTTILTVLMKETKGGTDARFELRLEAALPA